MKAATAIINRSALRHNLQVVRKLATNSRLIAIVKANAYGHGLIEVGKAVEELSDGFGVARLCEALTLREHGIMKPILLLEGFFEASELVLIVQYNIDVVIHCKEQLAMLEKAHLNHPIKVWMKLDTGMHRLGIQPQDADAFYEQLKSAKNVDFPINIVSHFCQASAPELPTTVNQINCFKQFISDKVGEKSISASAGILLWPEAHFDTVRPGIMMYGASPVDGISAKQFGLRPVMTLKSSLIAVREHFAGQYVGYGETWCSDRDTRLGVVAIGYGDGYPRNVPSGTPVVINGRILPIVSRISMDMTVVDLGPDAEDKVGDDVILWGESLPVEEISKLSGILNYELLTKITPRVPMIYVDE